MGRTAGRTPSLFPFRSPGAGRRGTRARPVAGAGMRTVARSGWRALWAPEHDGAIERRRGQEAVGPLEGDARRPAPGAASIAGLAPLGARAGAVPDAGVLAAARREPAARAVEGEVAHLCLVAAHLELDIAFGHPEMDARILVAGDEPAAVGRPGESLDAVRVGELLLRRAHRPGRAGANPRSRRPRPPGPLGVPGKGCDRFRSVPELVAHRGVRIDEGQAAPGRRRQDRGAGAGAPPEVFNPGPAERGRGHVLGRRLRVPELDGAVLAPAGQERGPRLPGDRIRAVLVAGNSWPRRAPSADEKRVIGPAAEAAASHAPSADHSSPIT